MKYHIIQFKNEDVVFFSTEYYYTSEVSLLKAKKLIKELENLINEYGDDIDVQAFSSQLGVYKELYEVKRIWIEN